MNETSPRARRHPAAVRQGDERNSNVSENNQSDPSPTERRISRLVVPEPAGFPQSERIDWVHDVEPEQFTAQCDR